MTTVTLLEDFAETRKCSFCHSEKVALTTWTHTGNVTEFHRPKTLILFLCFHGCQNFPEPFKDAGCETREHWERTDKHQGIKRVQARIRRGPHDGPRGGVDKALREMGEDHQQN